MAVNRTVLTDEILEKTTPKITATIKDEDGNAIASTDLNTLTLTFWNLTDPDNSIINNRNSQNVLNANNVTVDTNGLLTWTLQPADTTISDSTLPKQTCRAMFEWTYNSGTRNGKHLIDMVIVNITKVS